ncbi:Uncharacterized protein Tcan_15400 [Toxocara canis]|uniref:Cortactin-binding protein-2 N-terminal domain-containing protein n=1 Tax=Toxocara canis TaxID=6265 RepID=A0A0B2W1L7_TOXCA|nr:Uncharacterized protein Tcan_15400 [Toxocara canis]
MEGSTSNDDRKDFSREDLLRLLSYLEGELQARDVVIAALKSERAKQLLYQAKYGRLAGDDPMSALQRDSNLAGAEGDLDEAQVGQMYESQLSQLEKLICVQRRCHARSKQILAAAERRHARILRELDDEKQRSAADAAQGDDLCALLENERTKLRQQLEYEQKEKDKVRKEMERLEKKLLEEKERHKSIVLFLIDERKQMLVTMHQLRMHPPRGVISSQQESALLAEMRKELNALRSERDQLRKALAVARSDAHALKEVVRSQEEDLALMRNSILANSRPHTNNMRVLADGSVVVTNKAASGSVAPTKSASALSDARNGSRTKLSTSSSFPSGDRNAPLSRVPMPSASRPALSPSATVPPSPTRRHAATSSSTVQRHTSVGAPRNVAPTSHPSTPHGPRGDRQRASYATEPEIEQLGAVIDSMNSKTSIIQWRPFLLTDEGEVSFETNRRHAATSSSTVQRHTSVGAPRNVAPTSHPSTPHGPRGDRQRASYATEPEIEQLGAVIDSMNSKTSGAANMVPNKRSASLPRNNSNGMQGAHSSKQNAPNNSSSKSVSAPKRSVLFKAFGVSSKSDRNG